MAVRKEKHITENIAKNIEELIFPALNSLRRKSAPVQQCQIDVLKKNLCKITSDFGCRVSSGEWQLSGREIEICNLVKEGLSTSEIANVLCSSKRTIDNHRSRIRKKLGISNNKTSLRERLKSLE